MLDSARCLERPEYYRRFIQFASERGSRWLLWHFTDDQGCSLRFDSVPEAASPHAFSKAEMRELVAYAKSLGVEIIPELASLGHSRFLTRLPAFAHLSEGDGHFSGMCPVSDQTRAIMRSLIEECVTVFDSANFHAGLDEVNIGGHPLTKAALETRTAGGLLADHANFIHSVLAEHGRRMWMWGDCLLAHKEMLAAISREVVICNWQYAPDLTADTTQTLLDAGFNVVLCSAMISHDQMLFPGERFALPNVSRLDAHRSMTSRATRAGEVLGHINTIWTPVRFIADSLWLAVDLAAAVMRRGEQPDVAAHARAFGERFHGLTGDAAIAFEQAAAILFANSPLRRDWLSVVKLEPLADATLARITIDSECWTQAHGLLASARPGVTSHLVEFDAFLLLAHTLAHTYDTAVRVADAETSSASLSRLARRGQAIVDQIDRAWNRERFADDPRKLVAPVASFQNDHLLPLLQGGLTKLKHIVADRSHAIVAVSGAKAAVARAVGS